VACFKVLRKHVPIVTVLRQGALNILGTVSFPPLQVKGGKIHTQMDPLESTTHNQCVLSVLES